MQDIEVRTGVIYLQNQRQRGLACGSRCPMIMLLVIGVPVPGHLVLVKSRVDPCRILQSRQTTLEEVKVIGSSWVADASNLALAPRRPLPRKNGG